MNTKRKRWLNNIVVSAAAMAGVAIASNSDTTPNGLLCSPKGTYQCGSNLKGFNKGADYGFWCSPLGYIDGYTPCDCLGCCVVKSQGDGTICRDPDTLNY
ncbi:uncharacterized protein EDB93DRAFT_1114581 [Suillus bovinus]|uniref:uncharacterized protein n=1 Tax=Suillus bovinus TaxID=48563 RepID=UPI001B86C4A8|nr:uncharacterized protein EDB93DRAFT_1114581 [Suillus bovinus]KAG2159243.1 hypothetical protein EDB93DRAFT_1114581 [Suillus bovinus]